MTREVRPIRSTAASGSGLGPTQVAAGLSMEGTIQPVASRSSAKGSPRSGRGSTRTRVSASARSLSTRAEAKASTSSTRTPGRCATTSRQSEGSAAASPSSGAAITRKSRAPSLVSATNQPVPPPAGVRWSTAYSTPSRRPITTVGAASGSAEGMASHSVVLVLWSPISTKASSRVDPVLSEKRRSASS